MGNILKEKWKKEYEEAEMKTFMECPKCRKRVIRYEVMCRDCKTLLPITYDDTQEVIKIPGMAMERIIGYPASWLPNKILYGRSYHPKLIMGIKEDLGCWVAIDATKGLAFTEKFHTEEDVWKWINYEPVKNFRGKWLNVE